MTYTQCEGSYSRRQPSNIWPQGPGFSGIVRCPDCDRELKARVSFDAGNWPRATVPAHKAKGSK